MRKINSGLGRQKCNLAVNWRIRPLGKKIQPQFSKNAVEDSTKSLWRMEAMLLLKQGAIILSALQNSWCNLMSELPKPFL